MTKRNVLYAVGAIVVVLSTLWMVRAPDPAPANTAAETDTANTPPAPAPTPPVTTSPIVQAHEAYTAFQQHSRRFFNEADQLDEQKRQAKPGNTPIRPPVRPGMPGKQPEKAGEKAPGSVS